MFLLSFIFKLSFYKSELLSHVYFTLVNCNQIELIEHEVLEKGACFRPIKSNKGM